MSKLGQETQERDTHGPVEDIDLFLEFPLEILPLLREGELSVHGVSKGVAAEQGMKEVCLPRLRSWALVWAA